MLDAGWLFLLSWKPAGTSPVTLFMMMTVFAFCGRGLSWNTSFFSGSCPSSQPSGELSPVLYDRPSPGAFYVTSGSGA